MESATPVVVDTDVISFIFKDHPLAPAFVAILAGRPLTFSLITLAEFEYGMEAKGWGIRRRELMGRFLSRFKAAFAGRRNRRPVGANQEWMREKRQANLIFRPMDCRRGIAMEYRACNPQRERRRGC